MARSLNTPAFLKRRIETHFRRLEADWEGIVITHDRVPPGPDAVFLRSNDYLNLGGESSALRAQADELLRSGQRAMMSSVFDGDHSLRRSFERSMADFLGCEDTTVVQSGYAANTGLLQCILGPETPAYVDFAAHYSLWEGVRIAGATPVPLRHNSPGHLEASLRRHGPGVIIVDSVYSGDGSVAPLKDIATIALVSDSVLVVDESHSLGTHGEHGHGLVRELNLEELVHFRTASLAKAFCGTGGIIAGDHRAIEYLRYTSGSHIFSTAPLPHQFAGFLANLEIIRAGDDRRQRLRRTSEVVRAGLERLGYDTGGSQSQILSLVVGSDNEAVQVERFLEERGVYGSTFAYPAAPKNRSMIRFSLNSGLTEEDSGRVISACEELVSSPLHVRCLMRPAAPVETSV